MNGSLEEDLDFNLRSDHFYAAVMLALSIPESAAALASPEGASSKEAYLAWYEEHLSPLYPLLTGRDCWELRAGVVPNRRLGPAGGGYARILFTVPSASGTAMHNQVVEDALQLDIPSFCRDFMEAGRRWLDEQAGNETVQRNLKRSLRLRPAGLEPYLVGVPLMA